MRKDEFNEIGIDDKLDYARISKLLKIGLCTNILLIMCDYMFFKRELYAFSIVGIIIFNLFASLSYFGIYRLIVPYSKEYAHKYRTGIFGYLMLSTLSHITYLSSYLVNNETYYKGIVLPCLIAFIVVIIYMSIIQIFAFKNNKTPLPSYCLILSSGVVGLILLIVGLIFNIKELILIYMFIGNIYMYLGLLIVLIKTPMTIKDSN